MVSSGDKVQSSETIINYRSKTSSAVSRHYSGDDTLCDQYIKFVSSRYFLSTSCMIIIIVIIIIITYTNPPLTPNTASALPTNLQLPLYPFVSFALIHPKSNIKHPLSHTTYAEHSRVEYNRVEYSRVQQAVE
jgi:hypothetical protein